MQKKLTLLFKRFPALSYAGSLFIFIAIEALFSFCSKSTCPPFADANFDQWFPYQINQHLYFLSSAGNKDTITIQDVRRSDAYQTYGSRDNCTPHASISSIQFVNFQYKLSVSYDKPATTNYLNLSVYDLNINSALLNEQNIESRDNNIKSSFTSSVTLGGKSFSNVTELRRDTTNIKQAGMYKIWISKQAGVVAYEHYPTREQWVKQ